MATLHVRNFPDDLHDELRRIARSEGRSLGAQVARLLHQAVEDRQRRRNQSQVLADLRIRRFVPPLGAPDSLELLREDRGR